ncbi:MULTISPECIES: DM13 domain-containing protein [Arthrobacter]|uniref:DM13 domain-containing protein n=2 Tax=Arthrobacter TaxID=1663 RepID=A0ABU9KLT0_9MICC|nr:DM13 domain-containing protein [Arthrobacter sp. YJM1]MDP5228209.1 DM13 domain-containing protein [Arthrobacter sp. YJM1]
MRKAAFATVLLATASLGLAACGSPASSSAPSAAPATTAASPMMTESMSHAASLTGGFAGLNGKKVAGMATLTSGDLMLSGFSSDMGPDLHVYLTKGTDEASVMAGKEIAPVKSDAASQSFMLNGIMTGDYGYVVIHCDKAKAVFGAAKLQ